MQTETYILQNTRSTYWSEKVGSVVAVAGLMMLSAWVRVPLPFTPVPVTLQTLTVFLVSGLLMPARVFAGVLLYMGLGLLGAPVFAVPFGPTFGYILGFSLAPFVIARFRETVWGMPIALSIIYILGASWLGWWSNGSLGVVIITGVLPFLPADILKMMVAHRIVRSMQQSND